MHHMAVVRAWPWASITRAVTTVWRIGRRTPTLYRFKWCGASLLRQDTSLCAGPGRREHGNGQPFSELTNDSEVIDVLVDALKQSRGKADIKFLYQRRLVKAMQAMLRTISLQRLTCICITISFLLIIRILCTIKGFPWYPQYAHPVFFFLHTCMLALGKLGSG